MKPEFKTKTCCFACLRQRKAETKAILKAQERRRLRRNLRLAVFSFE